MFDDRVNMDDLLSETMDLSRYVMKNPIWLTNVKAKLLQTKSDIDLRSAIWRTQSSKAAPC